MRIFTGLGLALCIIDCGADHAALTNEYASIPEEMSKVAAHFGKKVLREVKEEELLADLAQVRKEAGDRAVLRALHFYADDRRAAEEADALERKDKEAFLNLVKRVRTFFMGTSSEYYTGSSHHTSGHGSCIGRG